MKNKKLLFVLLAMLAIMSMVLSSCAPETIEDYYAKDSGFKSEMDKLETDNDGLKLTFKGNEVIYDYDVVAAGLATESEANTDIMKSALQSALDDSSAASTFESLIQQIEDESKIEGVKMTVTYLAGNTVLASKTYESK